MCVHESQAVYCTTELCLSVEKLKEEKKTGKERCLCAEVNVYVVYILSTVKTENTYTPARLEALFSSHQSSVIPVRTIRTIQDSKPKFLRKRLCSQSIQMFREEICSVVLRVHSTHR